MVESRRINRTARRRALKEMVSLAKRRPCLDCDQSYPHYVMDFDHVRGEKIGHIAVLVHECVPIVMLEEEIMKCDVVCANCHRERTFSRIECEVGEQPPC